MKVRTLYRTIYPATLALALYGQSCAIDSPAPEKSAPSAPVPESAFVLDPQLGKMVARGPRRGFDIEAGEQGPALRWPTTASRPQAAAPAIELTLLRYGCPAQLQPARAVAPQAAGNRLFYPRAGLTEWYRSADRHLEQGFSLERSPCETAAGLVFEVGVGGATLVPAADGSEAAGLLLRPEGGGPWFRYDQLHAVDAEGRALAGRMAISGRTIRLEVDDQTAHYPVTVDPLVWIYAQKLAASDGAAGNLFGKSAALSGDVVALGAPEAAVSGKSYAGAAYLFARSGATWMEQAKLSASDVTANAEFGQAIAASGDTVVVGAPQASAGAVTTSGAAYVYVRSGTTWTEQAKLVAADAASSNQFGRAVAISGDTILVGAPYASPGAKLAAGAAYVFVRSGTTWTQQTKLVASDGATTDWYGTAVALAGDTAVCGAIGASRGSDADAGAAYVYTRSGTTWAEQAKLAVATTGFFGGFGNALALDGDTLTIGTKDSSAYVYVRSGTTWSQQLAERPLSYTFGSATAVVGNTALFGAPDRDAGAGIQPGRVHIYTRSGTTWSAVTQRSAVDGTPGDLFGTALALAGDWLVVGAPEADLGAASNAGAAYVFQLAMDRPNGQGCVADSECTSGNCIDAVCCDTTCGYGSSDDCQACSVATGAAVDGTCGAVKSGVVCRKALDLCDAAETCTGTGTSCPADKFLPSGTTCRAAAGVCDNAETCSGTARSCPSDTFKSSATLCRAAAGLCDRAEYCTGTAAACPSDTFQPLFTVCRPAAGSCDVAERCSGLSVDCPADSVAALGTSCRSAAGPCDVAETCTGTSIDCPADSFQPSTYTCRASAKDCDAPETCTGKGPSCPSDQQAADGAVCSVGVCARGACQPEADLQVALTADPTTVHGAQPVQFTAVVKNAGRGEATTAVLTLAYPPTAALAQLGGPGWGCQSAAGGAACTLDKLAASGSATLTMQLIAPAELALFNVSAQAKAATPDPVPENNFVTVLINNDRFGPGPGLPDLGGAPDLSHVGPSGTDPGGGCSYGQDRHRPPAPVIALLALLAVVWRSRRRAFGSVKE